MFRSYKKTEVKFIEEWELLDKAFINDVHEVIDLNHIPQNISNIKRKLDNSESKIEQDYEKLIAKMKQKLDVISIRVPDVELASGADFYKTYFPNYFADGVLTFEPFQLINHYVNINQSYILQEKRKNKNDENLEAFKPCSDNHSSINEGEMYAFNDQCYDEELMAIHVIKKLLEAYIIKDISKNCMFNSILQKDMRSIYDFININRQRAHRAYKSFHAMDSAE